MKILQPRGTTADPPVDADRWALVERTAASPQFSKSPRLRQFLLYIGDRALRGKPEEINEQQIGSAVFGRAADYDTTADNIVRVEARHLRKRLEDYFAAEGVAEPVLITVPKGGYVPVFEPRRVPEPVPEPEKPEVPPIAGRDWRRWLPWALTGALSLTVVFLLAEVLYLHRAPAETSAKAYEPLWSQLFDEHHQTSIVTADSNFALVQDLLRQTIPSEQYISGRYLAEVERQARENPAYAMLPTIAGRQYTSVADVAVAGKILQLNHPFADRTAVRFARNLQIRDFRTNNAIILGSARANPWASLFEQHLNFVFEYETGTGRPLFRNESPKPGESAVYKMGGADGKSSDAYGVIALLPNLAGTGNVLIIAGVSMEGTEAAGDFVTNPDLCAKLTETMGVANRAKMPPFEVLLKLRSVGGSSSDTRVVAYRLPTF